MLKTLGHALSISRVGKYGVTRRVHKVQVHELSREFLVRRHRHAHRVRFLASSTLLILPVHIWGNSVLAHMQLSYFWPVTRSMHAET